MKNCQANLETAHYIYKWLGIFGKGIKTYSLTFAVPMFLEPPGLSIVFNYNVSTTSTINSTTVTMLGRQARLTTFIES